MALTKKTILLLVVIIGFIVPFIPELVIFELSLLIPFATFFILTIIFLIITLSQKRPLKEAIFIFILLPTFIFSQIFSCFTVSKIQKIRSQKLISKTKEYKSQTGQFPEKVNVSYGIEYSSKNDKQSFEISYSVGFMVTEKYFSRYEQWRTYGWRD